MKTIGILTLPLHNNFGGILQSYALQLFLTRLGYNVVLLDRQYNENLFLKLKYIIKRIGNKKKFKSKKQKELINANPTKFINTYILPKTEKITSDADLRKVVEFYDLDAIVVGSDQVWRLDYLGTIRNNFFLDFVNESKILKMSYAASFGIDYWNHSNEVTSEIKTLLQKFDRISVREDTGIDLCKDIFEMDAVQHVDPTMLLNKEEYEELTRNENEPQSPGDILVYMLDVTGDRQVVIDTVEKVLSGQAFMANKKSSNLEYDLKNEIYPTITSWLRGFMDAKFVVVDSFHGCVFSILFNKPFVAYGNKSRGLTRFTSMLKQFSLEDRLILNKEDLTDELIYSPIDWEPINQKLNKLRQISAEYLSEI